MEDGYNMAFIRTWSGALPRSGLRILHERRTDAPHHTPQCTAQPTRRAALILLAGAAAGVTVSQVGSLPAISGSESPGLPAGAREFSRLLSARRQWGELRTVLSGQRELEDAEWESLRAYLRTIYQTTGDMDFLAKAWDNGRRKTGEQVIKRFRATVKGMDKPAAAKDVSKFAEMHEEAAREFDRFFELLKEASVGDIPEEL